MAYIQRKYAKKVETVDQFETWREATKMVREYRLSDPSAEYYISTRPCKAWRNGQ